eukprot:3191969-Pyramimonas_sp.AAC.1
MANSIPLRFCTELRCAHQPSAPLTFTPCWEMYTGSKGPTGTCIRALYDRLGHVYGLERTYWDMYTGSMGLLGRVYGLYETYLDMCKELYRTYWDMYKEL